MKLREELRTGDKSQQIYSGERGTRMSTFTCDFILKRLCSNVSASASVKDLNFLVL